LAGNRLAACVDHAQPAPVFRHRLRHIPELTSGFNSIDTYLVTYDDDSDAGVDDVISDLQSADE